MLPRDVGSHTTNGSSAPAVAVAVTSAATTAPATALSSTAATTTAAPLLGPVAALAVNRTIAPRFEGYGRGLTTAGAHHGGTGAHTAAASTTASVAAAGIVMSMRGSMPATPAPAGILLSLAAWLAAPRRGVATLLEELLFARGEDKLLTAVATGK